MQDTTGTAAQENEYLGKFMGEDVWITPDHRTIWTSMGTGTLLDFAYPLDLNGTFQNWVAKRV